MAIHGKRASHTGSAVVILVSCFTVEHPQAYVDPGSASYLFQFLAGGVLAGLFMLRTYWGRMKASMVRMIRSDRVAE